jgi:hypothetical protein
MLWPFFRVTTPDQVRSTDVLAYAHGIGSSGRVRGITWREWFAPGSKAISIKIQQGPGSGNRRRPPEPTWDQLDGKAREEAWRTIQLHYQVEEGGLLPDKEILRRYRADYLHLQAAAHAGRT